MLQSSEPRRSLTSRVYPPSFDSRTSFFPCPSSAYARAIPALPAGPSLGISARISSAHERSPCHCTRACSALSAGLPPRVWLGRSAPPPDTRQGAVQGSVPPWAVPPFKPKSWENFTQTMTDLEKPNITGHMFDVVVIGGGISGQFGYLTVA